MSPNDTDDHEDMRNSEDALFDLDEPTRENTPTPDANPHHTQPEQDIEVPEWVSLVQGYLNTVLPHLVDAVYHRIQAVNAMQPPPMQSTPHEVQMNSTQSNNTTQSPSLEMQMGNDSVMPSPPMPRQVQTDIGMQQNDEILSPLTEFIPREVQMNGGIRGGGATQPPAVRSTNREMQIDDDDAISSAHMQPAPQQVQTDDSSLGNIPVPTETNIQQAINHAVGTAIPALVTAMDERVERIGTMLGTAVSTMEATANRAEGTTQRRARNPRRPGKRLVTRDGYDSDIEVAPEKPKKLKSAKLNKQHEYIRKWLADRGVLCPKDRTPISPTDEEVAAFDIDHAGGPVTGLPVKLHWKSGFSSNWNRQAIFVLVSEFLAEHRTCDMTKDDLQDLFGRKLERTRRQWILSQMRQQEDIDRIQAEQAKKNRRRGRLYGTYYRRGRIIDEYFDNNPIFWGQVQQVYDLLGPDGMSSDETDDELGPNGIKTVTRVARVWLSGAVSSMWDQIEHYHHDREGPKQGNRAFGRTFAPKNTSESKALCDLPKNYYNSLWWTSLISVDQHHLTPADEVPLPDLTILQNGRPSAATTE